MPARSAVRPRASRLAEFLRENSERIMVEWESFARGLPAGDGMDIVALRDHAKEMLDVIALDLETRQSEYARSEKSKGRARQGRQPTTAAMSHGSGRAQSGFNIGQMVAEFRALRATVIRMWTAELGTADAAALDDVVRFNEAIDQAIAESVERFTQDLGVSKERFLAILAHDLRTPLGAVVTSAAFMLDAGELREPNLTLVTRIGAAARRMNQMVLDLLDFTRTRFGDSIPVVPVEMDVRRMVHDVVSEVATTYPDSPIHVETFGELRGRWDPDRLVQMLTNLVTNAVAHGSPRAQILVSARGLATEIVLSVTSHGQPIPKDLLPHLFEAMKGLKRGSRDRRHLGLGLYIVEKIVSAHGGSIEVKSTSEHTMFTVHLPRAA
jgi:signal transduction histidine kinase